MRKLQRNAPQTKLTCLHRMCACPPPFSLTSTPPRFPIHHSITHTARQIGFSCTWCRKSAQLAGRFRDRAFAQVRVRVWQSGDPLRVGHHRHSRRFMVERWNFAA
ncbi:hypothetical protein M758_1G038000 [Ceratodon purpureus]|nr:hypothetical protein M758_1G038000 [Ceratodon purpureus]